MGNTGESINLAKPVFERGVVVGCGMGGIAAAAALKDCCEEVIVIEKDKIPDEPISRRGVPQDEQLHNLLTRAQIHLDELLPGFCDYLRFQEVGDAIVSTETHVFELGMQMPERNLGLRLMSAWRPKIEHTARELLMNADNISLRGLTRATGLAIDKESYVRGLRVSDRRGSSVVDTPLVVDSSGTGSRAHEWLRELGYESPPVDELKVDQWYVSMIMRRPEKYIDNNSFWLTFPNPPGSRGGLVSPLEGDKWYVSLSGRRVDVPPRTHGEMLEYALGLEDPVIAELIEASHPISTPKLFKKTKATWRRYDQLTNPTNGFLPLGDSIASLNPLFGQGISVAAWQAAELKDILRNVERETELHDATVEFHKRAAIACKAAWTLGDMVNGIIPAELQNAVYWERLANAIRSDPELHRQYVGVWHLIEPFSTLYSPSFLQKLANY